MNHLVKKLDDSDIGVSDDDFHRREIISGTAEEIQVRPREDLDIGDTVTCFLPIRVRKMGNDRFSIRGTIGASVESQ